MSIEFWGIQIMERGMVVSRSVGRVRNLSLAAGIAAATLVGATGVTSALADEPMLTKTAPMTYAPPSPAACGSVYDFFFTACPLTWVGVTVYGTVDMGFGYQTHGSPFDPNFPTGASYLLNKPSRQAEWTLAPNALSQSVIGIKSNEPIAPGWNFVSVNELAFDPYSALLANAPQAMQNAIGVPLNQQLIPVDSSKWGWLAAQNAAGVSSPTWGTLLFGRQNTLNLDLINAYDPMGGAFGFSPIGFSGATCGSGDTEECRYTTAIKYRVNIANFRLGIIGQPLRYGAYNPNNGAIQGEIGGDFRLGPGILSTDIVGAYDRDAVNIGPSGGFTTQANGQAGPPFPANTFLTATISNNTSGTIGLKYTFGSWAPGPIVSKEPPPPPSLPLTLYAGYEYTVLSAPSDPQSAFYDDGFFFTNPGAAAFTGNGTAINNTAFSANCGGGGGCSNRLFQITWVGAKYGITKNLDITAAYYQYWQNQFQNTAAGAAFCGGVGGATAHGTCSGTEDFWSLLLDWRFLPKWDVYVGTFFSQANGGFLNGYLARNNLATTTGVRFRF
ncbi:MAG: porin [Hyphomicrobiales bacterium]|nr:porin [Hyphomicrobiales bacterium]